MASRSTAEFRVEVVWVALTGGLPRTQVAADFGIGVSTLNQWTRRDRRCPEERAFQSDLEGEIAELRTENRRRRVQRDVQN